MALYQSASGYPGMEAGVGARVVYSDLILSRVYENDWLPRITTSDLMEEITRCGQVIQLMRAPEVGPMRSYQKNQQLVPNTVGTDAKCLTICNIEYQDVKFDKIDLQQLCDRRGPFEEKMLESMYQSYVDSQRKFVLGRMMGQVSPMTSFSAAGRRGDINLGEPGNPVHVTPQSLVTRLFELQRVLTESKRWVDNEMFIIVPPILRTYLAHSNYANAEWSCKCGGIVSGMWDHPLAGFQPIESIHVPTFVDAGGNLCYYIIAGSRQATAYASNIIESRVVDNDPNSLGVRYQFFVAFGAEVIYPDALAMGYWTFDNLNP